MIQRVFVEKKVAYRVAEAQLSEDIRTFLGVKGLEQVRLVKRYDVEGLDEATFRKAVTQVFSEAPVDDWSMEMPKREGAGLFAVEPLPGQFDQRSDSASSCIQLMTKGERPLVRSALLYYLYGNLSSQDVERVKAYVINPVDSREAGLGKPETLQGKANPVPAEPVLTGFIHAVSMEKYRTDYALAMDDDDLAFVQAYFTQEGRDPTLTELRVIDTYWSDHCRHTTFCTHLDEVRIEDEEISLAWDAYLSARKETGRTKPVTLMDLATIGASVLKKRGVLTSLDESPEINACTVNITVDGEDWLLLFKNETHNHPTEIEPFGGAATCIGGAIRDPLSGRAYVYQAMRITGCGNPLKPVTDTLPGRIPQKKLAVTAAAGYSSYGNQVGLATGLVDELYHDRYQAKHMELGAVIGAVPKRNVRREAPVPGDIVLLVGGRTGRDGCGGATGSSKSHTEASLEKCGAEVQKGNAPEERKLQRLMRNAEASLLIKRCNDFGAGGVSVAIGELAEGLDIDLDAVKVKYQGLSGTELAISESQERMAVVVGRNDVDHFSDLARRENLEVAVVACVTDTARLVMRFHGHVIVDIKRKFLDTNGAPKHASVHIARREANQEKPVATRNETVLSLLSDLNVCSKQGLSDRFDSTIGRASVLMPYGGRKQKSPSQVMCALLPTEKDTEVCSVMSYGCDPLLLETDPFAGGYASVTHSLAKLAAAGCDVRHAWLSLQEFFGKPGEHEDTWGEVCAALLGALKAQLEFGVAAIGGKDSMSGTFGDLDVPPTLVSFAVAMHTASRIIPDHFRQEGHLISLLQGDGTFSKMRDLASRGVVFSAYAVGYGGIAEALCKMSFGNQIGFHLESDCDVFAKRYGAILVETGDEVPGALPLGRTIPVFRLFGMGLDLELSEAQKAWEQTLEPVYPRTTGKPAEPVRTLACTKTCGCAHAPAVCAKPSVLIPVFPGTNCEIDLSRALSEAGFHPVVMVVGNLDKEAVETSAKECSRALSASQVLFIPGGFSGGDEPDGSGKFIASFLRNPDISEAITRLLDDRKGLVAGICNGFQALVKLGLLPYGSIRELKSGDPTLTFNTIGRHQSMLVRTRVCSVLSPWLSGKQVGDVDMLPVSHGEGRFVASDSVLHDLIANGQIATQYVDESSRATMQLPDNPNGSVYAIEGITSPDGRILGRMAHSERYGSCLYRNTPYHPDASLFRSAFAYFR